MLLSLLLCLGGVFLVLAQHPFVTYPLSLLAIRRFVYRPVGHLAGQAEPIRFAVCVCAYNEEAVIRERVENLLAVRECLGELDILIYVDAATDRTSEILAAFADRIVVVVSDVRTGKSTGMNTLMAMVTAPIVIFTDADVMFDPKSMVNLGKYFRDPQVGCVSGHVICVNPDASTTAEVTSTYWDIEQRVMQLESDTGSAMGAHGSITAIRRALFRPIPPDIIDDLFRPLSILCEGYRVVRAADVIAFEEQPVASHDEFRRKIRVACQAFNVHRLLWPRLRHVDGLSFYKYVSHKLLRWLAAYTLGLSALSFLAASIVGLGYALTAIIAVTIIGLLLVLRLVSPGIFAMGREFLLAILAAGLGVWKSLKGERIQTWNPPPRDWTDLNKTSPVRR